MAHTIFPEFDSRACDGLRHLRGTKSLYFAANDPLSLYVHAGCHLGDDWMLVGSCGTPEGKRFLFFLFYERRRLLFGASQLSVGIRLPSEWYFVCMYGLNGSVAVE